jgi:hypothetical protein
MLNMAFFQECEKKALGSIYCVQFSTMKTTSYLPGMVALACKPRTWEAEAEGLS